MNNTNQPSGNAKVKKNIIGIIAVAVIAILGFTSCKPKQVVADEQEVIKIATLFPLTGPAAETGVSAKEAVDLCIEKWNISNKLGKKITVIHNDSQGEGKLAAGIARQILLSGKPNIVISGISPVVLGAQPIFEDAGVIQLGIVSTDNLFYNNPKFTLRNYYSTTQVCDFFVTYAKETLKRTDFTLFYVNSEFGNSYKNEFQKLAYRLPVRKIVQFNDKETDYRNNILKASLANDELLYISAQYQTLGILVKQIRELGFKGLIVSDVHLSSPSALDMVGNRRDDLYYIDINQGDEYENVSHAYHAKFNRKLDGMSLIAYNGIDTMLNFMLQRKEIDNQEIMKTINGFSHEGITGVTRVINNEIVVKFCINKL